MRAFVSEFPAVNSRLWTSTTAAVAFFLVWVGVWYREALVEMVTTWYRSETFAHGFVVIPISLWLVWRRRADLAATTPLPSTLPLLLLAGASLAWLVGELADVVTLRQYALVTTVILGVWSLLGTRSTWLLAFPLVYLLFAVPFGEFLIPGLMEYTADFVLLALRASGVPVYREGMFLQIPTGNWSIVEGCSGLRYLIASVTLGCLYAYLTYASYFRRAVFIVASAAVPVVANWLRAYIIVMIGHLSDNRLAHGVDHLIYGWVFFGAVMLLMFWVGSYWRDDVVDSPVAAGGGGLATATAVPAGSSNAAPRAGRATVPVLLAAAVLVAAGPLVGNAIERANQAASVAEIRLPERLDGWERQPTEATSWKALFTPPRADSSAHYIREGVSAGIYLAAYRGQDAESKLVSTQNLLVRQKDRVWDSRGAEQARIAIPGVPAVVEAEHLRGPEHRLLTWRWYRIDGETTSSDRRAKLLQLRSQALGRGDGGAIVLLYVPYAAGAERAAQERLEAFARSIAPAAAAAVDAALGAR